MNYQIRNLKTLRGREGRGYTGALYLDDRKIADVEDFADGGPPRVTGMNADDQRALRAYVIATMDPDLGGERYAYLAEEMLIASLADDADLLIRARRMLKAKTLFTVDGRTALAMNVKPSADAFALARRNHPNARFLVDMPEAEAVKLLCNKGAGN